MSIDKDLIQSDSTSLYYIWREKSFGTPVTTDSKMGQHDNSLANMLPKFCEQTAASRIALIIHFHSGDDNFIAPRLQNTQAAVIISSDITSWNMYSHLDIPQIRRYVLKSRCKSTICFILASTSWSTDEMLLETSQKLSLLGNSVSLIYAKNRTTSLARYQAVPSMPASCPAVQRRKCVIRCDSPSCCEYSSVTQCPKDPKHHVHVKMCWGVFGTCQWQMISRELLTSHILAQHFWQKCQWPLQEPRALRAWLELCDIPQIGSDRRQSEGLWWPSLPIQNFVGRQSLRNFCVKICPDPSPMN